MLDDSYWLSEAIRQAEIAKSKDEVPIGAVVVKNNKLLGAGYNQSITKIDPTAHAEIMALRNAASELNNYRLLGTTLYSTVEPCPMCFGALLQARVGRLVFGAYDKKFGALGSIVNLTEYPWNHNFEVVGGIQEHQCKTLLVEFFKSKR